VAVQCADFEVELEQTQTRMAQDLLLLVEVVRARHAKGNMLFGGVVCADGRRCG